MAWFVYIIECTDESLYTGITTDVNRRFQQHMEKKGAKYFRSRVPKAVVYVKSQAGRSQATQRELRIKKMTKTAKRALVDSKQNQWLA